jgi:phage-related protein
MTTFTYRPSYQASRTNAPKVWTAAYGDGYTQRTANGINNDPTTWNLTFDSLDSATATAIVNFLAATGGAASFTWTNPDGQTGLYICPKYDRSYDDDDKNQVKATFQQVFGG